MQQDRADGLTVIEGGKGVAESVGGEKAISTALDLADRGGPPVGSKAWATKTRRRAKELVQLFDSGYMELARILYQVFDTPVDGDARRAAVYTAWGYDTFKDYSERELGMHHKKAERLRRIWFTLEIQLKDLPIELKQRVVNLGFAKVRELIRILTMRNAEALVSQAESMNYKQLEAVVADEYRRLRLAEASQAEDADGDGEAAEEVSVLDQTELHREEAYEKTSRESFDLFPGQMANVRLALSRAAELCNSDKKGHQLDLICTDFIATNDVMAGDTDKRLRYIAKMERALGLKLVAIDPETKDAVYGIDNLRIIADG